VLLKLFDNTFRLGGPEHAYPCSGTNSRDFLLKECVRATKNGNHMRKGKMVILSFTKISSAHPGEEVGMADALLEPFLKYGIFLAYSA
jgi:hypothetical protein